MLYVRGQRTEKKVLDTLAKGEAANTVDPFMVASASVCSMAARARGITGWARIACTLTRKARSIRIIDFLTANTSPSQPFISHFHGLAELTTANLIVLSRSNRPGCHSVTFGSSGCCSTKGICGRLCIIPDAGRCRLAKSELRVAPELDEVPEIDRSDIVV